MARSWRGYVKRWADDNDDDEHLKKYDLCTYEENKPNNQLKMLKKGNNIFFVILMLIKLCSTYLLNSLIL
jgi:hypothetical protein